MAQALRVAPSSVLKWSRRQRATGSAAPGQIGGHVPRKIGGDHAVWLRGRMAQGAFTLRGLVAELAEQRRGQADMLGKLVATVAERAGAEAAVQAQDRVGDRPLGGEARVQAVGRVLEHH